MNALNLVAGSTILQKKTVRGEHFPVMEDERGTYFFNSKDLCLLPFLPDLMAVGLDSLKIEGRMKSIHYVATVVKVYRQAIDAYMHNPRGYEVRNEWLDELTKISHRPYTSGFYFHKTTVDDQIYGRATYTQNYEFLGLVNSYDPNTKMAFVEQRNNIKIGEEIEVLCPEGNNFCQLISRMTDENGIAIAVAPHPQQLVYISMIQPVVPLAMLRRKVTNGVLIPTRYFFGYSPGM